ncbi:MAG: type II toxin-antitoxin system RelE/ParE family toxin [Alteromonadaceae bacterium]|nr:type II toxin-antitoxin system RelE/ParE family toxin [Alteromonadaceae bacterium]MBL4911466.1 type II toxin-antitoxin system RelE/ParE family toxin [Alteromonadaceae bacterium]
MRIFKSKWFNKWAEKEGLMDKTLTEAITEMEDGLNDGELGGHVYKKRAAIQGQGKRGGLRTIIAFKVDDKSFFMFGFAKNQKDNIDKKELKALKLMAKDLLSYSDKQLKQAIEVSELIEVKNHE